MIEVVVSEEKHKEALIACADRAFGDQLPEGGFAALLPKLYGMDAKVGGNHLIAVEDGKFLGVVLTETMRYHVLDKELKIGCVGTVSVIGEARGRGIMKRLMDAALDSLRASGCDFVFLGGQRQRYAYWGFEPCGTQTCFSWNRANLKHGPKPGEGERLELVLMPELTEQARRMYEREPVRVWRAPERFYDILCSWQARPYACMRQGAFVGYVALGTDTDRETAVIREMVLDKGVSAGAVLHALADCLGIWQGTVTAEYARQDMMRELDEICESQSMSCGHRFRILNWRRVLEAMLGLKQYCSPIEDGEAVLGIREHSGKRTAVRLRACKGQITAAEAEGEETEGLRAEGIDARRAGAAENTVELTAAQAARMLFSSTQIYHRELEGIPRGWFPLPLYVREQDCC